MSIRTLTYRLLKAAGLVVLFLFVLEISARMEDWAKWDAPFFGRYSSDMLAVADSLGWHNRPSTRFQKWSINSYGFRGPEVTMEKPEGVIRIAVVGASETFGLYESPGMDYPSQIQTILDSVAPGRYQVLNAGCPGMAPPRIRHYFNAWLHKFEPDILVYYPSPTFYLLQHPPQDDYVIPDIPPPPIFTSRALEKAAIVMKRFLPDQLQNAVKQYMIDRAVRSHPPEWVFEHPPEEHLALLRRHLAQLATDVAAGGTRLILATHAMAIADDTSEVNRQRLTGWRKLYPHVAEPCFLEMETEGNAIIKEVADSLNVTLVDLQAIIPRSPEYFADHLHFTDEGARLVAENYVRAVLQLTADSTAVGDVQ